MHYGFDVHRRHPHRVLISAHRCGAGDDLEAENTLHALKASLDLGVDYVEFDVRRRSDGSLVIQHDHDEAADVPSYAEMLTTIGDRAGAHIDLKFGTPDGSAEVEAIRIARELLSGPIIATSGRRTTCRALREWRDRESVEDVLVGYSIGSGVRGLKWRQKYRHIRAELFPVERVAFSKADVLVAQHVLAAATLKRLARRLDMQLLVWTVDDAPLLRWWTTPGMAWMVTTNYPARAIEIRAGRLQP